MRFCALLPYDECSAIDWTTDFRAVGMMTLQTRLLLIIISDEGSSAKSYIGPYVLPVHFYANGADYLVCICLLDYCDMVVPCGHRHEGSRNPGNVARVWDG